MNKRCIVNVATGHFYVGQQVASMFSFFGQPNFDGQNPIHCEIEGKYDGLYWQDIFPIPSRGHEQSPYGFKAHAIRQAYAKGYKSILWTDSPAMAQAMDIAPIFERIEYYGYYAMSHHDPLENWVGDTALKRFGMTRDQLKGFHLPSGSCYGFDLSQAWVRRIFDLFCQHEEEGLFKSEVIGPDKWHRHDEAILALLLIQHSLPVFFNDPLFQSDSPECVIRSGANWTQDAKVYGG